MTRILFLQQLELFIYAHLGKMFLGLNMIAFYSASFFSLPSPKPRPPYSTSYGSSSFYLHAFFTTLIMSGDDAFPDPLRTYSREIAVLTAAERSNRQTHVQVLLRSKELEGEKRAVKLRPKGSSQLFFFFLSCSLFLSWLAKHNVNLLGRQFRAKANHAYQHGT